MIQSKDSLYSLRDTQKANQSGLALHGKSEIACGPYGGTGKLKVEGDVDCIKSPIPISNVPGRVHCFLTDQGYLLPNKSHTDFTNTNCHDIFSSRSCGLMGRHSGPVVCAGSHMHQLVGLVMVGLLVRM